MKKIILSALLIMLVVVAGCNIDPTTPPTIKKTDDLTNVENVNFKSVDEVNIFFSEAQQNYGYASDTRGSLEVMDSSISLSSGFAIPESSVSKNVDFSGTNVQVQGVDEADLLKTNGEYIYTFTGNDLFVIKAVPGVDAEILSVISFNNTPNGLFLYNDKLTVLGQVTSKEDLEEVGFSNFNQFTFLEIYDVSDPENIEVLESFMFEGYYDSARLKDEYVYLVTKMNFQSRDNPLPIIFQDGIVRNIPVSSVSYMPWEYNYPAFVNVHSVNLKNLKLVNSKSIVAENDLTVYMSHENIFLANSMYINEWKIGQTIMIEEIVPLLPSKDKLFIDKVNAVDPVVMSLDEKQSKIMQVTYNYLYSLSSSEQSALEKSVESKVAKALEKYDYTQYTVINKIKINNGLLIVENNGVVPGRLNNQFAMDEYDSFLRVITTANPRYKYDSKEGAEIMIASDVSDVAVERMIMPPMPRFTTKNNVYVLNNKMDVVGSLEGLAEGESVYSSRYMGEKLYLVTFRQVDPFFVIDLSNPVKPENLGELKIPGYSRYLHPYDENTIIGIGREGTETGRTLGYKITLFDVTDTSNPKELVTYTADESSASTSAEWEHKAMLFSKEKDLLVIPVNSYDYKNPSNNMNGAMVFIINKEEITPRGLIAHKTDGFYGQGVERSLYINDALYTKSPGMLRINDLETLQSIKDLTLSSVNKGPVPVY